MAGPSNLAALLNSLQMGFRTLAIEQRSSEVWQVLRAVKTEFGKFGEALASVKKTLDNASNKIGQTEVRTRAMLRNLKSVEALPEADARLVLGGQSGQDADDRATPGRRTPAIPLWRRSHPPGVIPSRPAGAACCPAIQWISSCLRQSAVDIWSIASMGTAERHDPSSLDATGLAAAIADGQITASQAMREALERVAARNPDINAVCGLREDLGLSLAARTDEELAGLTRDGRRALLAERPFLGVPTLLKDLGTAALGLPMGSVLYGQVEWNVDAEIVVRYRRAGLIPFGRSTSAELGLSPLPNRRSTARPRRIPGSPVIAPAVPAGRGAALASGMVHIAHGSDGGGSIRIPASCCGVLGLKPSRGLMPLGPLRGRRLGRAGHRAHDDPVGARLRRRPGHQRRRRRGRALCRAGLARAILPRDRGGRGAGSARRRAAPHRLAQHDLRRRRDRSGSRGAVAEAASLFASLGHELETAAPPVGSEEVLSPMLPLIASAA